MLLPNKLSLGGEKWPGFHSSMDQISLKFVKVKKNNSHQRGTSAGCSAGAGQAVSQGGTTHYVS